MTRLTALSTLAPPLAALIAHRIWIDLGAPARVHDRDRAVHDRATRGTLEIKGERVATYSWGTGPNIVLLVQGWRSRGSRFAALVTALESPDRTIVTFDAPGNGDSTGRHTTVLDYAEIIRHLVAIHGDPELIVGHSLGVLAMFLAVREGVAAKRLVAIAGVSGAESIVRAFASQVGLRGRAIPRLRRLIERRTFPEIANPWHYFTSEIDPARTHVPLLVVHDVDDPVVPVADAVAIAELHTGAVTTRITRGLGHSRILGDPDVVAEIVEFSGASPEKPRKSARSDAHLT